MKKVFAILHEPASYTVDRNKEVYDKLGVKYCYINSASLAKAEIGSIDDILSELSIGTLCRKLHDILRDNDIIIMNGYTGKIFVILFILNLYFRKPIGLDSDTQLNIPQNPFKRLIKKIYLSVIFRNKKIFGLPGGTNTHRKLFLHYGMPEDRICLMPMVVNNNKFITHDIVKPDVFRFLYVGRIVDVKNLPILLEAFSTEFKDCRTVELRVVGNGDKLDSLRTEYGRYKNIVFTGSKYGNELESEYKSASAFILPSSYEPWGLVVNEAMAAGLPVIVSDQVGAAWDLVEGQDTGFIFKFDDVEDLRHKMLALVEDKELYNRFSKNASRRLNEEWNYDFYTRCLLNFIEEAGKC